MEIPELIEKINERRQAMAAERDKLRELIDEIEEDEQRLVDAVEALQAAADRLSEVV
jgi:uncharacterized coiled-coil protein SlyX